ncbi:MAG: ComEC/Rec2 family competence protein [Endomicrobiia bacterium]
MKNLTFSSKLFFSLVYLIHFLYLSYIFIEETIHKNWSIFLIDEYKTKKISGKIKWYKKNKDQNFYILSSNSKDKILLKTDKQINFELNDKIKAVVRQKELNINNNYERYIYSQFFVNTIAEIEEVLEVISSDCLFDKLTRLFFKKAQIVKEEIIKIINENLSSQYSKSVIAKLSLGYEMLDIDELKFYFQEAGVMHVLVVSGLHVSFVYLLVYSLFKFFPLPIRLKVIPGILAIFFYMFITGFNIPVVRATIMICCFGISFLLSRKSNSLHSLFVASIIILLVNPRSLFTVSFQLSFLACFGILYFYKFLKNIIKEWLKKQKRLIRYVIEIFLVTASAQVMIFPLTVYYFGKFSTVSFISNIIVVPLSAFLLWISLLFYVFNFIFKDIFSLLWRILEFFVLFYIDIVKFFARIPFGSISFSMDLFDIFIYYFLLFLLVNFTKRGMLKIFLVCLFLILPVFPLKDRLFRKFEITFFDVGLGDCIFIKTEDNTTFLVDTPQNEKKYILKVFSSLVKNNIKKIDFLIVTHPHYLHYESLEEILKNFSVRHIVIPDFFYEDYTYEELLNKIQQQNIKITPVKLVKIINFKNGKIEVIKNTWNDNRLPKELLADLNSLLIKINYKGKTIVLTNDLPAKEVMKNLHKDEKILVLQIPRHGKYLEDIRYIYKWTKNLTTSITLGIVSTDRYDFSFGKLNFLVLSTHSSKDIKITFSSSHKIKKLNFTGSGTFVKI